MLSDYFLLNYSTNFVQICQSYHFSPLMKIEPCCHLILKIQFLIPYKFLEDFHLVTATKPPFM